MKLSEIIARVQKTEQNSEYIDVDMIGSLFNVDGWSIDAEKLRTRLTQYFLWNWMCSDTVVGASVMFLDDTTVYICYQSARKSPMEYTPISLETYTKTREWVMECLEVEEFPPTEFANLDGELGEGWHTDYGSQIMNETGIVDGETVKIMRSDISERYSGYRSVKVQYENGTISVVDADNVLLPFNID